MSFSHTITQGWSEGNRQLSKAVEKTANSEFNIDQPLVANATNILVAAVLDVSQMKSLFIVADKDCTIHTNANNGAGGNTIALAANVPVSWFEGCGWANPLTIDVTAIYLNNGSATDPAIVRIRALIDPTVGVAD